MILLTYLTFGVFAAAVSNTLDHRAQSTWAEAVEFMIVSIGWLPIILFVLVVASAILAAKFFHLREKP